MAIDWNDPEARRIAQQPKPRAKKAVVAKGKTGLRDTHCGKLISMYAPKDDRCMCGIWEIGKPKPL